MSEHAREKFNIEEQKAKDVLAAIKVIKPVISLIREWGKVEKEHNQISDSNKKLSEEIKSIKHVAGLSYSGGELKESLSKILEDKTIEYQASYQKEEELKSFCDNVEKEVILYLVL